MEHIIYRSFDAAAVVLLLLLLFLCRHFILCSGYALNIHCALFRRTQMV